MAAPGYFRGVRGVSTFQMVLPLFPLNPPSEEVKCVEGGIGTKTKNQKTNS